MSKLINKLYILHYINNGYHAFLIQTICEQLSSPKMYFLSQNLVLENMYFVKNKSLLIFLVYSKNCLDGLSKGESDCPAEGERISNKKMPSFTFPCFVGKMSRTEKEDVLLLHESIYSYFLKFQHKKNFFRLICT